MGTDCKYCGAYISGSSKVCPACGRRVKPEKKEPWEDNYASGSATASQTAAGDRSAESTYNYNNYADSGESGYTAGNRAQQESRTYASDNGAATYEDDVRLNRKIAYLCYFGPLFLIPYLTRPDSDFVKFHSNQGLLLLILSVIVNVLGGLRGIGTIFAIYCFIKGLISVSRGEEKPLPLIGGIRLLK